MKNYITKIFICLNLIYCQPTSSKNVSTYEQIPAQSSKIHTSNNTILIWKRNSPQIFLRCINDKYFDIYNKLIQKGSYDKGQLLSYDELKEKILQNSKDKEECLKKHQTETSFPSVVEHLKQHSSKIYEIVKELEFNVEPFITRIYWNQYKKSDNDFKNDDDFSEYVNGKFIYENKLILKEIDGINKKSTVEIKALDNPIDNNDLLIEMTQKGAKQCLHNHLAFKDKNTILALRVKNGIIYRDLSALLSNLHNTIKHGIGNYEKRKCFYDKFYIIFSEYKGSGWKDGKEKLDSVYVCKFELNKQEYEPKFKVQYSSKAKTKTNNNLSQINTNNDLTISLRDNKKNIKNNERINLYTAESIVHSFNNKTHLQNYNNLNDNNNEEDLKDDEKSNLQQINKPLNTPIPISSGNLKTVILSFKDLNITTGKYSPSNALKGIFCDKNFLYIKSAYNKLNIYDYKKQQLTDTVIQEKSSIHDIVVLNDKIFYVMDGKIKYWDPVTMKKCKLEISIDHFSKYSDKIIAISNKYLGLYTEKLQKIIIYDVGEKKIMNEFSNIPSIDRISGHPTKKKLIYITKSHKNINVINFENCNVENYQFHIEPNNEDSHSSYYHKHKYLIHELKFFKSDRNNPNNDIIYYRYNDEPSKVFNSFCRINYEMNAINSFSYFPRSINTKYLSNLIFDEKYFALYNDNHIKMFNAKNYKLVKDINVYRNIDLSSCKKTTALLNNSLFYVNIGKRYIQKF